MLEKLLATLWTRYILFSHIAQLLFVKILKQGKNIVDNFHLRAFDWLSRRRD